MAKNNQPLFVRSKLLPNNSAAEFVELRTGRFFGPEFPSPNGIEFAPDVDMFVARDVASSMNFENYFQASRDKCKEFEVLLIDFAKLIYDRNFEKKFQVKSKSFQEYKIQDVLEIAEKVQMKHGSISKVREHTAVFRKCFAAVGRNQGAVDNLLNFIPNDSYGSIIFGGFTLILTAIERAETLRETAYAALAEIPRKLEFINSLTHCHRRSIGIYQAGDSVLVALFGALTQIIDQLTRSKGKKTLLLLMKGKSYGSDLDAALASLDTKLRAFKDQVLICNSQRLGEMEQTQFEMKESQSRMEETQYRIEDCLKQVEAEKAAIAASQLAPAKSIEREAADAQIQWSLEEKDRCIDVLNKLYRLLVSNPKIDAYTGRYIPSVIRKLSQSSKSMNEKFAKDWLRILPYQFQDLSVRDMDDLLERSTSLSMDDQGKVQHIMADPKLFQWLNAQNSMVLLVQNEVAPDDLLNPLSFSSAFLARTLQGTYKSPVLYYNCRSRGRESFDQEMSGPLALLNTLNAQLIVHILATQGDSIDLEFLQQNELLKASRNQTKHRLRHGRDLFGRLIEELPESDVVFIIIDGMSWLTGEEAAADKVLRAILHLASHSTSRRIKLLLTDIISRTVLNDYNYLEVFVHSRIESGGQSLNLQFLREETQSSLSKSS